MFQFADNFPAELKKKANIVARKNGYGSATKVILGAEDKVISHTRYGYRKYTTGQYVPNSYRSKFGWKNTYYQRAETVVMVTPILSFTKWK